MKMVIYSPTCCFKPVLLILLWEFKIHFEECSGLYDLRASKLWPFFIFKWTVPSLSRMNLSVLAVLMIHTNFIISPGVFWSHAWNQSQKNGRWQREKWKKEEEKFGKENSRKMLHFITTGSQYNTTISSLPFHCFQKNSIRFHLSPDKNAGNDLLKTPLGYSLCLFFLNGYKRAEHQICIMCQWSDISDKNIS